MWRHWILAIEQMPFFSAVPSDITRDSFRQFTNGIELHWEDYQQLPMIYNKMA
jgi:hypothetical protein